MTSVMIATPAFGGQVTEQYLQSVVQTVIDAGHAGLHVGLYTATNESLITRARNNALQAFLESDFEQLLWIDADIGFSPVNVFRLVNSEHPITATPYPLKSVGWEAVTGDTADEKYESSKSYVLNKVSPEIDAYGFSEVFDAGTGFMCIKRSALEEMIEHYSEEYYYTDDPRVPEEARKRWLLFDTMVEDSEMGRRYLSEDYAFCRRWQNMGNKVYADVVGPRLRHFGGYAY